MTSAFATGTPSERELDVLKLIVDSYRNPEIVKVLYLSEHTVKTYVWMILNKLLVSDRIQTAVVALRSGLVSLEE
ncbi:MAG: LuxR C-terminal-related transcriptional regulator [Leptolyngbyaceae cyanobacterium bins.349]|nr:LuxR C-terminal-related transcriptional regulator [Leptolyngbyaceae cyanobacterium bins.349]